LFVAHFVCIDRSAAGGATDAKNLLHDDDDCRDDDDHCHGDGNGDCDVQ
jgi:hypothetical protein